MALTGLYGHVPREQAVATIYRALSMGVRLFDTAPLYGDGTNEELLGQALQGERDVFVTTKFGLAKRKGGRLICDSNPSTVRRSVECSLRRLRRERIDLLLQHRPDSRTPDDDVIEVIAKLVHEGKIAAFGLSSTNLERAVRFNHDQPVRAVQNEFSLLSPPNSDAKPGDFAEVGSAYMAYSPLARGALASISPRTIVNSEDYRSQLDIFSSDSTRVSSSILSLTAEMAARNGTSPTAVSLAWLLSIGSNIVAIPGARSPDQVNAALETFRVSLAESDLTRLNDVSTKFCLGSDEKARRVL